MTDEKPNRGRTRAIRARMQRTGESWTEAARHHDAEQGRTAPTGACATAQTGPVVAERDWATRARVRVLVKQTSVAPDDPWPATGRTFRPGEELTMVQRGHAGREVIRDSWWTSTDIDGAHIIDASKVEVLEVIEDDPPTWVEAALPAKRVVEWLGDGAASWAERGFLVIPGSFHLEVRADDGELLGLVDVNWLDRSRLPVQPITYRAVVVPNEDIGMSRSVPLLAGFVPPDPARAADAERTRWKGRENTAPFTPG